MTVSFARQSPGEQAPSSVINEMQVAIEDHDATISAPMRAAWSRSTTQSINNTTLTSIQFDTVIRSDDFMVDTGTSNTTCFITQSGLYLVNAFLDWASNTTGQRLAQFAGSNTTRDVKPAAVSGQTSSNHITAVVALTAGATLLLQVWQNSGGALNVATGAYFSATRIAL